MTTLSEMAKDREQWPALIDLIRSGQVPEERVVELLEGHPEFRDHYLQSSPRAMTTTLQCPPQMRKEIAKALYRREVARNANADRILSAAANKPVSLGIEPYEECADVWRGDADAVWSVVAPHVGALVEALGAVVAIADRKTDAFDRARAALALFTQTEGETP